MDDAGDLFILITMVMFEFGPNGRGNVRFVLMTSTS